ncbi:bifunctional folylpolyglutamate synthase/dihydrofolate synthase [Sporosarcina ureilytica]|uniref:tetrahydrofolate synthase n=1 Tax=Sporosarcina ureilytica TaxID=298596 RepID=A0A1D8JFX2_9BACL|nr:Mur ligase family protein [Sporosarcina ureilytica]AOV07593.1 hypothetical protein BI350_08635 [Sporosarcina ureilytica]
MIPKLNEYKERWHIKSDHSIKPGLKAIKEALTLLGNPEKRLNVIHVSGTNGKGSTIQFMESILEAHGYTTGVFSSPAIIDIHDQIRYNGNPVTQFTLDETFRKMKEVELSGKLTDFELLTVAAYVTFERLQPDYVLIETGMGGLLDSTNVVQPIVSVITSVALDHVLFLGSTIQEVATHKAGIIKQGTPAVVGALPPEALEIVKQTARKNDTIIKSYGEQFFIEVKDKEIFNGEHIFTLPYRKMKGTHQMINCGVAIEALLTAGINLIEKKVQDAVATAQLSYRFQEVMPNVYLDGAHNPAAAAALTETIENEFPGEKVDFIIGMLKGKDIKGTLDELMPVAASFTFLTFAHPDAATGEELMKNCGHLEKSVTNSFNRPIILDNGNNGRKIVTGSLYLMSGLKFL